MQQIRWAVLIALLYLATGFLSQTLAQASTESVPVWLASGITFSALLICARWAWPAILVGGGVASMFWGVIAHGLPWGGAIAFGAIEAASMGLGAWIATVGRNDPEKPAGAALLVAGALAGSAIGGLLAVQMWNWQRPGVDDWAEWLAWTCSTAVGLLLVAPVVVAFRGFKVRRSGGMPMSQFVGGGLAFLAFVITVLVVFGDHVADQFGDLASTLAYLPMPFLLVAALLWGSRGGALAMLLGSLLIVWRTAHGGGPFAITEDFVGEAVIEVQGFVAVWAVVMLLTRALSEDRRASLEQARSWRLRYERTMLAVGVASVEYDAITGRATWGEGASLVLGPAVASVGSVSEWLDRVDSAERGLVQANWSAVARGDVASSEQDYDVHLGGGQTSRVNEQLACVRGGDDSVEQVVALLRLAPTEAAA
jgi:integral membrane sensor domain MASE1